jgi:hypothetical protein
MDFQLNPFGLMSFSNTALLTAGISGGNRGCCFHDFLGLGGIEPPQLAYQASTLTIKLQAL